MHIDANQLVLETVIEDWLLEVLFMLTLLLQLLWGKVLILYFRFIILNLLLW